MFMAICGLLWFAAVGLLMPRFDIAAELELPRLCGGRGTERPAGAGDDIAVPRGVVAAAGLWPVGVAVLCVEAIDGDGFDELGGVIRLTVGREAIAEDGCAAGRPAFGPSMLARVGDTLGLPILALDRSCNAVGDILAVLLPVTGRPRWSVFPEATVNAPGLLAYRGVPMPFLP